MRCPDCRRFVAYDEPEVELSNEEFTDDKNGYMSFNCDVEITLNCADCSTILKQSTEALKRLEEHLCPLEKELTPLEKGEEQLEFIEATASGYERMQTTYKGKAVPPRFMKKFYGADVNITYKCKICSSTITINEKVEVQASSMDEV